MNKSVECSWNKALVIFLILLGVGLLYLLQPILLPFAVGGLLAYLTDPLVNRLMQFHISRLIAVIIVFFLLFFSIIFLILLIIPVIQKQIGALIDLLPSIINWVQTRLLPGLEAQLGTQVPIDQKALKGIFAENILKAGGVMAWIWQTMLQSGKALFEGLLTLILIPVVTFYLLRDWDIVIANIVNLIPKKIKPTVLKLTEECNSVLSAFFRGQFLVMLALCVVYSIGLTLIGLQVGVVIGIIAGLVSIVPYLGVIIGVVSASIAALVQFGTMTSVFWVVIVFTIGHLIENVFLTPKLIGDRIGLHPVAVIFAILAGGALFGFFGVVLALPVASVIMVLLRHLTRRYQGSSLYKA